MLYKVIYEWMFVSMIWFEKEMVVNDLDIYYLIYRYIKKDV